MVTFEEAEGDVGAERARRTRLGFADLARTAARQAEQIGGRRQCRGIEAERRRSISLTPSR